MADIVFGDNGGLAFLNAMLNSVFASAGKNLTIKLFVNDYTPAENDTAADYTEASGAGYASKELQCGQWDVALDGDGIPTASYDKQTWSITGALDGGATIYGYWVENADGIFLWAQKLTAITPDSSGCQYEVPPIFQLSKGTPS